MLDKAASEPNDEAQTVCPECGAAFPADEARCPYCGSLNPTGAEADYMHKLETLRENTDRLDDEAEQAVRENIGRNAKRTAAIVVAVIAIVAAFALGMGMLEQKGEQDALDAHHAREAFRQEHIEELDRLYEQGDDEALVEYALSLVNEPGFDAIYTWQHYDYLEERLEQHGEDDV